MDDIRSVGMIRLRNKVGASPVQLSPFSFDSLVDALCRYWIQISIDTALRLICASLVSHPSHH